MVDIVIKSELVKFIYTSLLRYSCTHNTLHLLHYHCSFQTAFFLTKEAAKQRCVMPTENAVLISSLTVGWWDYYNKFRPWLYQTVHFTTLKPWKIGSQSNDPFICSLLREWEESVEGMKDYYHLIPPLTNDYLVNCITITRPPGKYWYPTKTSGKKECAFDDKFPIDLARTPHLFLFNNQTACCAAYPDACG